MSGLGYGDANVAIVLTVFILICVAYLTITRCEVPEEARLPHEAEAPGRRGIDEPASEPT